LSSQTQAALNGQLISGPVALVTTDLGAWLVQPPIVGLAEFPLGLIDILERTKQPGWQVRYFFVRSPMTASVFMEEVARG
jgi:hypothetical protein